MLIINLLKRNIIETISQQRLRKADANVQINSRTSCNILRLIQLRLKLIQQPI